MFVAPTTFTVGSPKHASLAPCVARRPLISQNGEPVIWRGLLSVASFFAARVSHQRLRWKSRCQSCRRETASRSGRTQTEEKSAFDGFTDFVLRQQELILSAVERVEALHSVGPARHFFREPWTRNTTEVPSHGITTVLENGAVWEKAAVSTSILHGRLSFERAESLSTPQDMYIEGETYRACALSLVFHPRSPRVPTFRADVRFFELPERAESWFGGGADLTPFFLMEEDVIQFHRFWRTLCVEHCGRVDGEPFYARLKKSCDDYFYIPARQEHRGVGGIFFDQLRQIGGNFSSAQSFTQRVAEGWMEAYLPIVDRRVREPTTDLERRWQLLRRGRYVEFNLLYDRGVRFGLAQLEKVMVSAPPLVVWEYGPAVNDVRADEALLRVLRVPSEWGFGPEEGELVEFLFDASAEVAGTLPRVLAERCGLRCRGVGVVVLRSDGVRGSSCRVLCHRRSNRKATFPGCWDMFVTGLARPREESSCAAVRELGEELGLAATGLRPAGHDVEVANGSVRCHVEVFVVEVSPHVVVSFPDGEATDSKWLEATELRSQVAMQPSEWTASGLQLWRALEAHGGPEARCGF